MLHDTLKSMRLLYAYVNIEEGRWYFENNRGAFNISTKPAKFNNLAGFMSLYPLIFLGYHLISLIYLSSYFLNREILELFHLILDPPF